MVRFPPSGEPVRVAVVRIALRDITEAGAPARTVAEVRLPEVLVPDTGLELPFAIDADIDDPRRIYALRAHADRSGSGSVDVGDLVTTTTTTIDTAGGDKGVTLRLNLVE